MVSFNIFIIGFTQTANTILIENFILFFPLKKFVKEIKEKIYEK